MVFTPRQQKWPNQPGGSTGQRKNHFKQPLPQERKDDQLSSGDEIQSSYTMDSQQDDSIEDFPTADSSPDMD